MVYACLNCGIDVKLNTHGRCSKCNSEAVVLTVKPAKPVDIHESVVRMDIVDQIVRFRAFFAPRS